MLVYNIIHQYNTIDTRYFMLKSKLLLWLRIYTIYIFYIYTRSFNVASNIKYVERIQINVWYIQCLHVKLYTINVYKFCVVSNYVFRRKKNYDFLGEKVIDWFCYFFWAIGIVIFCLSVCVCVCVCCVLCAVYCAMLCYLCAYVCCVWYFYSRWEC